MAAMTPEALYYIVHHVILPPKLPQHAEEPQIAHTAQRYLVKLLLKGVQAYRQQNVLTDLDVDSSWAVIETMLTRYGGLSSSPSLQPEMLIRTLALLNPSDVLPIQLTAANAALVLRGTDDGIVFECFESSPKADAVMAAHGSLIRFFPAHAVSLPWSTFTVPSFRRELAQRLSQLDAEVIEEMLPQSHKAGSSTGEVRDTSHPGLVSDMLMSILAALGKPFKVQQIRKRTRDDVLWSNCLLPWRRSALWLTLRVTMQSTLAASLSGEQAMREYKNFMIFFLARVAATASAANLPYDLCHVMIAKIARRASKLGTGIYKSIQEKALEVCQAIRDQQDREWQAVQEDDADRRTTIVSWDFECDTALSLYVSKLYLDVILDQTKSTLQSQFSFKPTCETWLVWQRELPFLSRLHFASKETNHHGLAEFETWVAKSLPKWREQRLEISYVNEATTLDCRALAELAAEYREIALTIYDGAPEQLSIMFMIITELRHALDLLALKVAPLLEKFSPSVPAKIFEPLLLPERGQMERLRNIETHIASRRSKATRGNPSIFSDPGGKTFPVQYYESSHRHKSLRDRIENEAAEERARKEVEWRESTNRYQRLKKEAKQKNCEDSLDRNGDPYHDTTKCKKCTLNAEADSMTIQVHEWPLPENESFCKSAVFELDCPVEISAWRNLTWMLIQDLGREGEAGNAFPAVRLPLYSGLAKYVRHSDSRLTLASSVKPFIHAHYASLKFPVLTPDRCLVKNGLKYQLFDPLKSCWVREHLKSPSFHARCKTLLPQGPYSHLQYAVDSVHHTQNQVIADQECCSKELSLHEFVSFGCLRSDGERIQWPNINREIRASNLNLNTESVCTLLTQAAYQVGSHADSALRNSHSDLADEVFCKELLGTVEKIISTMQANWKSDYTVQILIMLVLRVVSLNLEQEVIETALGLLQHIRLITYEWTDMLSSILYKAINQQQIQRLQTRLLKTAMLCKMTFDVDEQHVARVMRTNNNVSIWVVSSIYVNDNRPHQSANVLEDIRRLMMKDMRITHKLHRIVRRLIVEERDLGLDLAISRVWSGFEPGSEQWSPLETPNDRWLRLEIKDLSRDQNSQEILYNILNGELLVDGKPIGRLPKDYVSSGQYIRVLGAQILHVFSANMPGMHFMSAQKIEGYTIYFGKRDEEIVIRIKDELGVLELFPHYDFHTDLPSSLIKDYVHWLNAETRRIEFRPLDQRWTSNSKHWCLEYNPGTVSRLVRAEQKLVDVRSATVAAVMEVLGALELLEHIHVTFSKTGRLEIALPRYDLHFFLNEEGYLECRELCKIVDPNQSIGTMIGLKNRLVLCASLPLAQKHDRIMVVPEGSASLVQKGTHVQVIVSFDGPSIRLFRFQIDGTLRRLQEQEDIQGTLYKAYLHALTSHALPDPLTERTGTEEAISYLRQKSISFTKPPDFQCTTLLRSISELTPCRAFYPSHLRVMQYVQWHSTLSILAQHDEFLPLAQRIIKSGNSFAIFHPESGEVPDFSKGCSAFLRKRAEIRNSFTRNVSFGGDIDPRGHDIEYEARDRSSISVRGKKTFETASLIHGWPQKLEISTSLSAYLSSLETISGFGKEYDVSNPLSDLLNVDFSSSWAPLHGLCRASFRDVDIYKLIFLFSTIAYGRDIASLSVLRTLLAFAFIRDLSVIRIPANYSYFKPSMGTNLDEFALCLAIKSNLKDFQGSGGRRNHEQRQADVQKFENECSEQTKKVFRTYKAQWPYSKPNPPSQSEAPHLNLKVAHGEISELFYVWTANKEYQRYLAQVQPILDDGYTEPDFPQYLTSDWHSREYPQTVQQPGRLTPNIHELISGSAPIPTSAPALLKMERLLGTTQRNQKLHDLISALRSTEENYRHYKIRSQYRDDLLASCEAFGTHREQISPTNLPYSMNDVLLDRMVCESHVSEILTEVRHLIGPSRDPTSKLLELGGIWPRLTPRSVLTLVATTSKGQLTQLWKDCLLAFGVAITMSQRARRLLLAAEREDISTFCNEAENEGHKGWKVSDWPDWLLIEIEGDFLIRPVQARVALEMIRPLSGENSLIQLNMGEGKSSVIVPQVAVAIADGTQLARIVVLKSLAKQMTDTIFQRLSGLVNRQLYFMPFSRKVQMNNVVVGQIQDLQRSCMEQRGILLAQPEHILSFKLMGIERLTSGDSRVAASLMTSQHWLESNARDILDESDELLDVKFQLIYTLGSQRMMDCQPDRWLITQSIFDLVEKYAAVLEREHSGHIEIKYRTDASFPHLRILSTRVGRTLISYVAHDTMDSKLPGLNFERCSGDVRTVVLRFLLEPQVSKEDCDIVMKVFGNQESFMQKLLLVQGLFAYKILLFVLRSKRWSVNYGLHPVRCLSAVPYRAKGVPAPSAEFGHPDVAIALTCMSYYYSGLTAAQFRTCLEILQKSDDPSLEYTLWTRKSSKLPDYLRSWTAVNLEDDRQFYKELYPNLRYGKKVVDYFMANVVFPREGKEFDEKLSTSGWDLVSKNKSHVTTGFSGTNDNRFVLPLSIVQQDLPELMHTSGKVLDFVLRRENQAYYCARDDMGRQLSTKGLIQYLSHIDSRVRVLIDVGAQVLDTQNRDFVAAWMDAAPDVDAGVFFDEDDNIMVLSKDLKIERLSVSSFQSRMDRCVVYLDEVHTRGTDLKLPPTVRAAVTLGPRLTKDRLVQACMRLRKLGYGQSLMFLAPPEVHQKIKALAGKDENALDGYNVVAWSLEQNCLSIERSQPLRIMQGLSYHRRQRIVDEFTNDNVDLPKLIMSVDPTSDRVKTFREKEEQRLRDLYAPSQMRSIVNPGIVECSRQSSDRVVKTLLDMWKGLDPAASAGASMHEEHEREVAHEVEQETQVQRPPKVTALKPTVDPLLKEHVWWGDLATFNKFLLAHARVVNGTSAANGVFGIRPWSHLRVTKDFADTVARPLFGYNDNYLRPVNWVLTSKHEGREAGPESLLLLSQFEVNEYLRDIQKPSSGVRLHVYEPRVTKSMGSVDFGIDPPPPSMDEWQSLTGGVRRELNLFAGQLYFSTYSEYQKLCEDLGPRLNPSVDQTLSFVKAWIAIRRKGQNFTQTHLGQMVNGRSIKEEAFE